MPTTHNKGAPLTGAGSSRLGDLNGWTPFMMKMFLISWPVFLTVFFSVVGAAFLWGHGLDRDVRNLMEYRNSPSRFDQEDAAHLREDMRKEWMADIRFVLPGAATNPGPNK